MKKEKNGLLSLIKNTWQIWALLLSLLVGMGIIQIEAVKIVIPKEYLGHLVLGIMMFWAIITVILSYKRISKLEAEVDRTQRQIENARAVAYPSLFIEDIPLQSLIAHVERRMQTRTRNPVQLELFDISCQIVGQGTLKDADVIYHLKGTNTSTEVLHGLYLSIAGDNFVTLKQLNPILYDLTKDKERKKPLKPRIAGMDSVRKDLFLPFLTPGTESYKTFDIELRYMWPGIFGTIKDYWFLDNIDFSGVTQLVRISLEFVAIKPDAVRAYALDIERGTTTFLGAVASVEDNPNKYVFEAANPQLNTYYILIFEGSVQAVNQTAAEGSRPVLRIITPSNTHNVYKSGNGLKGASTP